MESNKSKLRILHLEDDPADAELVQETLATENILCDTTRVTTEGELRTALQQGGFDLMLADYTLPSFDGLSALRILREQKAELPFIFVSGTLGEEVAIEALKIGATDYVLKTRLSRLAPAIRRALREAEEIAERRKAEEALRKSHRELERERGRLKLVLDFTNTVASTLDLPEIFRGASAGVRRVMKCDLISILLPDREGKTLRALAIDNFPEKKGSSDDAVIPIEGTAPGKTFTEGKPFIGTLDSISIDSELSGRAPEGENCSCLLPLIGKNKVLGVLTVARRCKEPFQDEEVDFLIQIANQLTFALENALAYEQTSAMKDKLAQEKSYLEDEIRNSIDYHEIIGKSGSLLHVLQQVETVAPTDSTVLVLGETGTGKELIARAIHNRSLRKDRTFVKLNCAAIPSGLLESELFGHEKGSFTGAIAQRTGRLELADQGTLFLDEIGDIPLELQSKLLRALQEREFERLGSSKTRKVDIRLIAATNRDLHKMVADHQFRADLYYRLNVFPVRVPALRERPGDIPLLVRHFVQKYAQRMNKRIDTVPSNVLKKMSDWQWPGNVRELENFVERSVILTRGNVLNVPLSELKEGSDVDTDAFSSADFTERNELISALKEAHGRIGGPTGAAEKLGIKRTTLIMRMKKYGIDRRQFS
jgi:formate hydrogenlyase transcriptional activator